MRSASPLGAPASPPPPNPQTNKSAVVLCTSWRAELGFRGSAGFMQLRGIGGITNGGECPTQQHRKEWRAFLF